VALVDRNLAAGPPEAREAAEAFARHLFRPGAQREFVACGFRTASREVAAERGQSAVKGLWEVERRLGDWVAVQKKFFDEGVRPLLLLLLLLLWSARGRGRGLCCEARVCAGGLRVSRG
jgi:ABC-type sulfate transport system substrate-binding protein